MNQFYTYVHARPETFSAEGIFYVGKGKGDRVSIGKRRNSYHENIVAKHGKENILVGKIECSSELIAFDLEKGLIKCLKRMGIPLANLTDGGEGCSGVIYSAERRAFISTRMKEALAPQSIRDKMSASNVGKHHTYRHSEETRKKISAALVGRKCSEEQKEAVSRALKGKEVSLETRAKLSASLAGKKHSAETILKIAASKKGQGLGSKRSAETRAKLSAKAKEREERKRLDKEKN